MARHRELSFTILKEWLKNNFHLEQTFNVPVENIDVNGRINATVELENSVYFEEYTALLSVTEC